LNIVEYEYDKYKNPYYSAFKDIGFEFINFLPLSANNLAEIKSFWIDDEENIGFNVKNTCLYVGDTP
jgi:hypothetical protein